MTPGKVLVVLAITPDGKMMNETFDNAFFVVDESGDMFVCQGTEDNIIAMFPKDHFSYVKKESSLKLN